MNIRKLPAGIIAMILFDIFAFTFLPMWMWSSSQGPTDMGAGLGMAGLALFFWLPLLIAAFIVGIVAIVKNRRRDFGIITVILVLLTAVGVSFL